ncbi:MAG: polysaccharide deacetylase family protein [Salinarimonas sp.]|nr:polysaccharide deacetylase family protein [Salinarimonas sp.]
MSLKSTIIRTGLRAIDWSRADIWLAPVARGDGVILMFHHVRPATFGAFAPNRLLEITPEFFETVLQMVQSAGFEFIGLDALPERLAKGGSRPFAVLTFDDGYRDNAEHALPILRRHGAPATFYITTGFADGHGRLWWLELEEAIRRLDRVIFTHAGRDFDLPARDDAEKQIAFETTYWRLRGGDEGTLLAVIADLAGQAGIESRLLTKGLCMNWDELAAFAANPLITIGAHTVSHPMLAKHDDTTAQFEIVESRERIAARLGVPVNHFAYPVGDPGSAGPRDFALAREAGFTTAVTTRPGHVFSGHAAHPHVLPRVSVNGLHQSRNTIRSLLSGVPFMLWNKGRRLNLD